VPVVCCKGIPVLLGVVCMHMESAKFHIQGMKPGDGVTVLTWLLLCQVLRTPVSRDMMGRVFNGSGKPIDGGCVALDLKYTSCQPCQSELSGCLRHDNLWQLQN
jgi:flagellar biosynthesis/type III secretory pathway ATPase